MQILWDEPKRLANLDKHGFDFANLDTEFFQAATIRQVRSERMQAIGQFGDRVIVVIFVRYGREALSIVSMRRAKNFERKLME